VDVLQDDPRCCGGTVSLTLRNACGASQIKRSGRFPVVDAAPTESGTGCHVYDIKKRMPPVTMEYSSESTTRRKWIGALFDQFMR